MLAERILGLDVGTKRIGTAVSDPLGITAQPLKVVYRKPEDKALKDIQDIVNQYNVKHIIVGLPKNMDGTLGSQAEDVKLFADKISKKLDINIKFEDERLSSKDAERILIEQNKKPSRNKGLIDVTAAVLILQQYLDKKN